MSNVTVDIRVDLVADGRREELNEAAVTARIAAGDAALLREARALDGMLRIGDAEIFDELVPVVHLLCFDAVTALLSDGAIFDYAYFSSNENARLVANGETVVLSGSDVPESVFPRRDLIRALYACGARWIAVLDELGRAPEANHLRPFAAAARSALAASGLA
jgi:hypothetical protein